MNLFRVLSPDEQAAMQAYADQEAWTLQCRALGATPEQCATYERSAQAFAATTIYPNSRIVAEARKAALDALARGEPMPLSAEQILQALWSRELARQLGV